MTLAPVPVALALMLLPAASFAFEPAFYTWYGFDTGFYGTDHFPYSGKAADLDNDGDPDLVVTHWFWPKRANVLINEGGVFEPPVSYATQEASYNVDVGDLDGDTFLDLIVANYGTSGQASTISVLMNQGDGTFAPHQDYPATAGPVGIAVADFNGDGHDDVAVSNYGYNGQGDRVALLLNDGSGTLGAPVLFPAAPGPYRLAAGHLNGDNLPDLAVACKNTQMAVLINTGGAFAAPVLLDVGFGVNDFYPDVEIADADLDNDLDLFYSSTRSQSEFDVYAVGLYRNDGTGAFAGPEFIPTVDFLGGPGEMDLADMNGDTYPDILTVHMDSGGWSYIPSDGTGGWLTGLEIPGGDDPIAIEAADMDGDHDLDFVVVNRNSLEATIHTNFGEGVPAVPPDFVLGAWYDDMDAADIDGDLDLDIAASWNYAGSGGIAIMRNNGAGGFSGPETYPGPNGVMDVKLRDLNGDDRPDLLWADDPTSPPYDFHTRMNLGDGTFGPETRWPVGTCGTGGICAFDMDNDDDLDVFLTDYLGCAGGGESNFIYISRNNGDGTFQPPYTYETFIHPEVVTGADLNGDDNADLIWTETSEVGVAFGNGTGGFGPLTLHTVDWGPKGLSVADFNGDEIPDIVTCNMAGDPQQSVCVLINQGDGSFAPFDRYFVSYATGIGGVANVVTGDVDEDGHTDIMSLNFGSNDFSYFHNLGDGTFEPHVRYGVGSSPTDLVFGDFTGDGNGDVAAVIGYPPYDLGRGVAIVAGSGAGAADVPDAASGPTARRLLPASPNPFDARTTIRFWLDHASRARLTVHDVSGRRIAMLTNEVLAAGLQEISWDGRTGAGRRVAPGVYLIRLETNRGLETGRVLLTE